MRLRWEKGLKNIPRNVSLSKAKAGYGTGSRMILERQGSLVLGFTARCTRQASRLGEGYS